MANHTITFDWESNVAYPVNLIVNQGATFKDQFNVKDPSGAAYSLATRAAGASGNWMVAGALVKSVAIGATLGIQTTFTAGITSAADGVLNISLGSFFLLWINIASAPALEYLFALFNASSKDLPNIKLSILAIIIKSFVTNDFLPSNILLANALGLSCV